MNGHGLDGWWQVEANGQRVSADQYFRMRRLLAEAVEHHEPVVVAEGITLRWVPAPESLDAAWEALLRVLPVGAFVSLNLAHAAADGDYIVYYRSNEDELESHAPSPAGAVRELVRVLVALQSGVPLA